jgi:hypothetical protein
MKPESSRLRKKLMVIAITIAAWASIFALHGFVHVRLLTGQGSGYEGEPGFLALFFIIWPGFVYFIVLAIILIVEVIALWWPLPKS